MPKQPGENLSHQSLKDRAIIGSLKKRRNRIGRKKRNSAEWMLEENDDSTSSKRTITVRAAFLIVLISSVCIYALYYGLSNQENTADFTPPPPTTSELDTITSGPPVFDENPKEIAEAFTSSTDPQERLQWVVNSEEIAKRLNQYPEEALSHPAQSITPMGTASTPTLIFARFAVKFANGNVRLLCVVPTASGSKIDWDAYARYGTASWSDLESGKVNQGMIRAFIQPAFIYSHRYRDDTQWLCYRISSPDSKQSYLGYARQDSKTGEVLKSVLTQKNRSKPQRITLSIHFESGDLKQRQLTITHVHSLGWVLDPQDLEDIHSSELPKL